MIRIVSEKDIKKITHYSYKDFIPYKKESYCYSPEYLWEKSSDKLQTYKYFQKVLLHAKYLKELFSIFQTILIEKKEAEKRDSINWNRNQELYSNQYFDKQNLFYDDISFEKLNYKEADALNTITLGQKIIESCNVLSELDYVDEELENYLANKKKELQDFSKQFRAPIEMNNYRFNYDYLRDIYIYVDSEIINIFTKIFCKYITSDTYYSNYGTSFFALETSKYLYFCGKQKGEIQEFENFKFYSKGIDFTIFENLQNDFEDIIARIEKLLQDNSNLFSEDCISLFYKKYNGVPKNFLDIISSNKFEGRVILSKDFYFFDEYDIPLVMTYLSDHHYGKNNDNKLLTKIFHLNKGNLSNYNNRTYENGLYNRFDEFIKKYSI